MTLTSLILSLPLGLNIEKNMIVTTKVTFSYLTLASAEYSSLHCYNLRSCRYLLELNYLNNQKAENEFTKSIDKAVGDARNSEKWRIEYMTMHMRDWDMKAEGREEGRTEKLLTQICKKLAKNKSLQQIADELEEDEDTIRPLYEAAKAAAPEYDVDKMYDSLFSLKK